MPRDPGWLPLSSACSPHVGKVHPLVFECHWSSPHLSTRGKVDCAGLACVLRVPGPIVLGRQEFPLTLGFGYHTPKPLGEAIRMALTLDIALAHTMTSCGCFQTLPRALAHWNIHPHELLPGRRAVKKGNQRTPSRTATEGSHWA